MTLLIVENEIILSGRCGVEEAEPLLAALNEAPSRTVVLEADRLHTALWQVLLAFKPAIKGQPKDTFVIRHVMSLVLDNPTSPKERSEQ